jgi:chemotaxis family two-component system sensor kinase Cph1
VRVVTTKRPPKGTDRALRDSAEARLARATPEAPALSPAALLHELQVHQVELELQNDELRRAQGELEAAHARYVELYDSAPVGYFTLDADGCFTSANLTCAAMLGCDRGALLSRPFSRFVATADLERWEHRFLRTRVAPLPPSFEVKLEPSGRRPFPAQLVCREDEAGPGGDR